MFLVLASHHIHFCTAEPNMLKKLFKKSRKEPATLSTLDKLHETLEMLEIKESVLQKKISAEVEKAKEFSQSNNKRAAIQCLKKKRLFDIQIEQLGKFQLRIHDQMAMLEGAKATTETVDAMRTGASAMKAMQKKLSVDDVDKTMDEVNDQTENMKQIQEALSIPSAVADLDDDDLEAELEDLEGTKLEEKLLRPSTTATEMPTSSIPAGKEQTHPAPHKTSQQKAAVEEDELAALQAEMAL